jgi:hypothetical protein
MFLLRLRPRDMCGLASLRWSVFASQAMAHHTANSGVRFDIAALTSMHGWKAA